MGCIINHADSQAIQLTIIACQLILNELIKTVQPVIYMNNVIARLSDIATYYCLLFQYTCHIDIQKNCENSNYGKQQLAMFHFLELAICSQIFYKTVPTQLSFQEKMSNVMPLIAYFALFCLLNVKLLTYKIRHNPIIEQFSG